MEEIAFINELETQNRRHDLLAKDAIVQQRLHGIEVFIFLFHSLPIQLSIPIIFHFFVHKIQKFHFILIYSNRKDGNGKLMRNRPKKLQQRFVNENSKCIDGG